MIASSVTWNVVLNHYTDQILDFALNILVALIIVGVGFKLSKWLVSLFRKGMEKRKVDLGVVTFSCSFLKIALRCIVIFMAVERLGVKGTSIVALFGSAGVAVGLALQGSLSNIAGGVLLLILKPFQVGDYIVVDGTGCEGEVASMDIFYTKLKTVDNRVIVIPNGTLSNSNLINNTKQDSRLIDLKIGIAYDSDIQKVKETMLGVAKKEHMTQDENIQVFVSDLADSSVIMGLRAWVSTEVYVSTKWSLLEHIKDAFDREGIEIPYNKLDVNVTEIKGTDREQATV